MHLEMKNGEEIAKKFFIVFLEIIMARDTKLFLLSTWEDFTQKVVSNSHLEESERQRTLSAVEVEGVGLGEGESTER